MIFLHFNSNYDELQVLLGYHIASQGI